MKKTLWLELNSQPLEHQASEFTTKPPFLVKIKPAINLAKAGDGVAEAAAAGAALLIFEVLPSFSQV